MGSELESDLLSPPQGSEYVKHPPDSLDLLKAQLEESVEESCETGQFDDEDPVSIDQEAAEEAKSSTKRTKSKRRRGKSVSAVATRGTAPAVVRARSVGAHLEEEPADKPEKKKSKAFRPSLILRLRPTNLQESEEAFFASGCTEAPKFTYAYSEEQVSKAFQENSSICFDYLPDAKRIMDKVIQSPGGVDAFMKLMYGEEKASCEELRDLVSAYLKDPNIDDKVEIRLVEGMLSAANVVKPSPDEKYVVNIARGPVSRPILESICDHEVGTHLLRMMNDEHQVWHGCRERYKLANPWTTEEGFATINTYISLPSKLLYPQALRYWAVCRGAQIGFVELFHELRNIVKDEKRCWQICCRIKRGMFDTSLPGAFYIDQAYFKGAVEILKHLDEVDFGRLYCGQIALQDMDKVHFLLRKEVVRLPRFLNSAEKLQTYLVHCRKLIKENMIETSTDRVCKRIFVRAGQEFFKKETKPNLRLTLPVLGGPLAPIEKGCASNKSLDLARLEDLARPKQSTSGDESSCDRKKPFVRSASESKKEAFCPSPRAIGDLSERWNAGRAVDLLRLEELAKPRKPLSSEDAHEEGSLARKALDLARLEDLACPRKPAIITGSETLEGTTKKPPDMARLQDLAKPRKPLLHEEEPIGADSRRPPDLARLLELAQPRRVIAAEEDVPITAAPSRSLDASRLRELSRPKVVQEEKTEVKVNTTTILSSFSRPPRQSPRSSSAPVRNINDATEDALQTTSPQVAAISDLPAGSAVSAVRGSASRRTPPRLPAGLLRAVRAASAADVLKAAAIFSSRQEEPIRKAIPIKVLQLDIGL